MCESMWAARMLLVLYDFLHFVHWNGRSFLFKSKVKVNSHFSKEQKPFKTYVCDRIWMVSSPCCLNVFLHNWHLKRLSVSVRKCVNSAFFEKNFLSVQMEEENDEINSNHLKVERFKSIPHSWQGNFFSLQKFLRCAWRSSYVWNGKLQCKHCRFFELICLLSTWILSRDIWSYWQPHSSMGHWNLDEWSITWYFNSMIVWNGRSHSPHE